jgi:hypothetical protein
MYRQLRLQHHLVQEEETFDIRPDIPGLTAKGFERWATLLILAHPDEEFERLQKAAVNMPINNPDDKKERFPKDISRRLFPKWPKLDIREDLIQAMEAHAQISVNRHQDTPTPRGDAPRRSSDTTSHQSFSGASVSSEPPYASGNIERERKPYSKIPDESAVDDTNPTTSTPIERERKPYSVAPGGGRVYDELDGRNTVPNSTSHPPPPPPPSNSTVPGLHRSTSNASRPINIPPPPPGGPGAASTSASHRMSASDYIPPHLHRDSVRRRNHSPSASMGAEFRRSDTMVNNFQPSSYEAPSFMSGRDRDVPFHSESRYDDDIRRYGGRESEIRRGEYVRGGSPSRKFEAEQRRGTYDEDYYRNPPSRRDTGVRNW